MSLMEEPNHAAVQLRVDEAILDYLMYSATHNLVENAKSALANDMYAKVEALVEPSLEMVDCKLLSSLLSHHYQQDSHRM